LHPGERLAGALSLAQSELDQLGALHQPAIGIQVALGKKPFRLGINLKKIFKDFFSYLSYIIFPIFIILRKK
jgi:hypothetical protein